MKSLQSLLGVILVGLTSLVLTSCASTYNSGYHGYRNQGYIGYSKYTNYGSRLPSTMDTGGRKVIYVNPNKFAWGAYDESGNLVKSGIATAGGDYCDDIDRPCRTDTGRFTISSLGGPDCISRSYPLPNGGGLMPYCMFFHNGQALHGSPEGAVVEANISHGCVRMRIPDAEWLRFNFANVGTQVVVESY